MSTLLQAVLIAAVPVCAAFAKKGIDALAKYFNSKRKNDLEKKYITAAAAKKAVSRGGAMDKPLSAKTAGVEIGGRTVRRGDTGGLTEIM